LELTVGDDLAVALPAPISSYAWILFKSRRLPGYRDDDNRRLPSARRRSPASFLAELGTQTQGQRPYRTAVAIVSGVRNVLEVDGGEEPGYETGWVVNLGDGFRYNNRQDMNDAQRFVVAMQQIVGKRLTYVDLIGKGAETAEAS
jgi:hypothetical protein